jgi:hypothetical protein
LESRRAVVAAGTGRHGPTRLPPPPSKQQIIDVMAGMVLPGLVDDIHRSDGVGE